MLKSFQGLSKQEQQQIIKKCKNTCCFSQKYQEGYIDPYGKLLRVPNGIRRVLLDYGRSAGGWEFLHKGQRYTSRDLHHGYSFHKSLEAVIELFKKVTELPLLQSGQKIHQKPNKGKMLPILGVAIYGNQAVAYFQEKRKTVQTTEMSEAMAIKVLTQWREKQVQAFYRRESFSH